MQRVKIAHSFLQYVSNSLLLNAERNGIIKVLIAEQKLLNGGTRIA